MMSTERLFEGEPLITSNEMLQEIVDTVMRGAEVEAQPIATITEPQAKPKRPYGFIDGNLHGFDDWANYS